MLDIFNYLKQFFSTKTIILLMFVLIFNLSDAVHLSFNFFVLKFLKFHHRQVHKAYPKILQNC